MRTKVIVRSFEEVIQILRNTQFDVREMPAVAGGSAGQFAVSKYGAAAILTRNPEYGPKTRESQHPVRWAESPGLLLRGTIAKLVDHGNQKLFETPTARVAATADALKAIHRFGEELREAIGEPSLYNQSLGTVSNLYVYDRVKGRPGSSDPTEPASH